MDWVGRNTGNRLLQIYSRPYHVQVLWSELSVREWCWEERGEFRGCRRHRSAAQRTEIEGGSRRGDSRSSRTTAFRRQHKGFREYLTFIVLILITTRIINDPDPFTFGFLSSFTVSPNIQRYQSIPGTPIIFEALCFGTMYGAGGCIYRLKKATTPLFHL